MEPGMAAGSVAGSLAGHVCTKLTRASLLLLVVPPLLLSSMFTDMALILQEQSIRLVEYGIGEETAAIELEAAAAKSAESAVADQTQAEMLEASAAEHRGFSKAQEEEAMAQQEKDAGLEVAKAEQGEVAELQAAVEEAAGEAVEKAGAAEAAGAGELSAEAAAAGSEEAAAAGVQAAAQSIASGTVEAAEAGEAVAAASGAAAESAVVGSQVASATAAAAEGTALAAGGAGAVEGTALAASSALGPVGLAVAAAGVGAAVEAPKVAAGLGALNSEVQADGEEIEAVQKEVQAGAEEAAAVTEQASAVSAQAASTESLALGMAAIGAGTFLQLVAFALQAPAALLLLVSRNSEFAAYVCCPTTSPKSVSDVGLTSGIITSLVFAPTAVLYLSQPWADSVRWAAALEQAVENPFQAISSIPGLNDFFDSKEKPQNTTSVAANASLNNQRYERHNSEKRSLANNPDARDKGRSLHATASMDTVELWPDWGQVGNAVHGAGDAIGKAATTAQGAVQHTVRQAGTGLGQLSHLAKEKIKDLRNGKADIRTTTVEPRTTPKPPETPDGIGIIFRKAAVNTATKCLSSLLFFLEGAIGLVALVACAELTVSSGRHSSKSGRAFMTSLAADVYRRVVCVLAVAGAFWVVSLILAKHFEGAASLAKTYLDQQLANGFSLLLVLTIACSCVFLICCAWHTRTLSQASCACDFQEISLDQEAPDSNYSPVHIEDPQHDVPIKAVSAQSGRFCFTVAAALSLLSFAVDELLVALERPIAAWAASATVQSFLCSQLALSLLPWGLLAPTILGYKLTSPYELLLPFALIGGCVGLFMYFCRRATNAYSIGNGEVANEASGQGNRKVAAS